MRVANTQKILELQTQLGALPQDAIEARAELSLRLVYAFGENDDQTMARTSAKALVSFLSEPISEELKSYIFDKIVETHAADREYPAVFETMELYQAVGNNEAATLRRYATAKALAKLYSELGYDERAAVLFNEILETQAFFDLKEFQRDLIANSMTLAKIYERSENYYLAYETILKAEDYRIDYAPKVTNQYVFGIVTLRVHTVIAEALLNLGRIDEAITKIDKTLPLVIELERDSLRDRLLLLKARIAIEQNAVSQDTLELLSELINRATTSGSHQTALENLLSFRASAHEALENIPAALRDRKQAMELRSQTHRDRSSTRSVFLTAEIDNQTRQERFDELETLNAAAVSEANRSQLIAGFSTLLALVTLVCLFGLYRAWKVQRRARLKLQSLNTNLKHLSSENNKLANLDELTGLPNRRNFVSQLDEALDEEACKPSTFWVGLIDLDGFKLINDAYGHPCGDDLLLQTAARLQECLGSDAVIARLGGDEFGFLCHTPLSNGEMMELGGKICDSLGRPFKLLGHRAKVSASIGFVRYPDGGQSRSELFERADFALYHAKQNGKGRAVLFSREHEQSIREKANLKLHLSEADNDQEFTLHFQPIVKLPTKDVVAYEALARWTSPAFGPVSPADFIPIAEEMGTMRSLTPFLLRKALQLARELPADALLSFNLSTQDVTSQHYAGTLLNIVQDSGFDPKRLIFEITETAMIRNEANVVKTLKRFREQGIRIALDDFGDGFLSINHLARLPLDIVKLDRSCVKSIVVDERRSSAIIHAICDLSKKLGMQTIVEGVETEQELKALQSLDIELAQGYLFGRPIPIEGAVIEKSEAAKTPAINYANHDAAILVPAEMRTLSD